MTQYLLQHTTSDIDTPDPQPKRVVDLENFGLQDLQDELTETVDTVDDSVVSILASKDFVLYDGRQATWLIQQQVWWWSGIIVSKEWYILTNKHVVEDPDASYTVMFANGEVAETTDARLDKTLDIAVLKVNKKSLGDRTIAQAVPFGQEVQVGQFALAIGNALAEFANSVTFGVVSGKNRKLTLDNDNLYAWLLQTDTSISEWNSGWPLFDLDGKVIAINTAVSAFGENIWFAIPISQEFVDATLASIQKYDTLARPFVWVRYVDLTVELAKEFDTSYTQWVYIAEVVPDSPADQIDLVAEDIITHIDSIPVDTTNPFLYQLFTKAPGQIITLTVISDGVPRDVEMELSIQ